MESIGLLIVIAFLSIPFLLLLIHSKIPSNRKLVGPGEFREMLDRLDVDVVVIESRGRKTRQVAFMYDGWKFTTSITNDFEFPENITLVGRSK